MLVATDRVRQALSPSAYRRAFRLSGVESAAGRATATAPRIAAWAEDAFTLLADLPAVHRVGLAVVEGGGRRLRFTASDRDGSTVSWCDVDAYDDVPLNVAVRSGRPVLGALAELEQRFAEFAGRQDGTPTRAVAAVPIVCAGRVLGGYVLYFDAPQPFDRRQHAHLARLGRELGAALRRAQRPTSSGATRRAVEAPGNARVAVHEVPGDLAAVSAARQFLRGTLADWDVSEDCADIATLCLSELVTNAVIHSHGGCTVRAVLADGTLTTTVLDSGASGTAAVGALEDPLQVHGRGLGLVEALSTRWGYEVETDGATVWFALDVE